MSDVEDLRARLAHAEAAITELSGMVATAEAERDQLWEHFSDLVDRHLVVARASTERWRGRALHAQESLGWNRKATHEAGRQVAELRELLATATRLLSLCTTDGVLSDRLREQIFAMVGHADTLGAYAPRWHLSSDPDNDPNAHQAGGYDDPPTPFPSETPGAHHE